MKPLSILAALAAALILAGCGEKQGDPNVGRATSPPAITPDSGSRPGTPGGPALAPPPAKDPMGGRSGAAAGK